MTKMPEYITKEEAKHAACDAVELYRSEYDAICAELDKIPALNCDCYLWDATAWDVFDRITTAYHGKQYYFREGNKVYSRDSGRYLTQQEALDEFIERISE